jgi:hypothetical protein
VAILNTGEILSVFCHNFQQNRLPHQMFHSKTSECGQQIFKRIVNIISLPRNVLTTNTVILQLCGTTTAVQRNRI